MKKMPWYMEKEKYPEAYKIYDSENLIYTSKGFKKGLLTFIIFLVFVITLMNIFKAHSGVIVSLGSITFIIILFLQIFSRKDKRKFLENLEKRLRQAGFGPKLDLEKNKS